MDANTGTSAGWKAQAAAKGTRSRREVGDRMFRKYGAEGGTLLRTNKGTRADPLAELPRVVLVYLIFWTMALKASASLYAISARAFRSRLMLLVLSLFMKTL